MENRDNLQNNITVKDIALAGMMIAVIEVCKVLMSFLPNIELTAFWVIMFTLYFGRKMIFVIPAFILIEGVVYGFGLWWIMYLYAWPLLALLTYCFRMKESRFFCSMLSGAFGLSFGFLCSFPYFFIGLANGGFKTGVLNGLSWWAAGIPWDIVHCIGNSVLMIVLFRPVSACMKKLI